MYFKIFPSKMKISSDLQRWKRRSCQKTRKFSLPLAQNTFFSLAILLSIRTSAYILLFNYFYHKYLFLKCATFSKVPLKNKWIFFFLCNHLMLFFLCVFFFYFCVLVNYPLQLVTYRLAAPRTILRSVLLMALLFMQESSPKSFEEDGVFFITVSRCRKE